MKTNEEILLKLKRLDETIEDNKEFPDVVKRFKAERDKFLRENPIIVPSANARSILASLITINPAMQAVKEAAITLAPHSDSVLIIGESGTGKELLARGLHGDRKGLFIDINCAGLPEYLVESLLFGHKRGAFTGADNDSVGLIEKANDGTLFLDEIGELGLTLQSKLLRVLQERKYRRVGDTDVVRETNARIVSATNHDLPKQVGEGKFRLDLYARLSTFTLITTPLRERREDIEPIVNSLDNTRKAFEFFKTCITSNGQTLYLTDMPLNVRDIQRYVRQWQVFGKLL